MNIVLEVEEMGEKWRQGPSDALLSTAMQSPHVPVVSFPGNLGTHSSDWKAPRPLLRPELSSQKIVSLHGPKVFCSKSRSIRSMGHSLESRNFLCIINIFKSF